MGRWHGYGKRRDLVAEEKWILGQTPELGGVHLRDEVEIYQWKCPGMREEELSQD